MLQTRLSFHSVNGIGSLDHQESFISVPGPPEISECRGAQVLYRKGSSICTQHAFSRVPHVISRRVRDSTQLQRTLAAFTEDLGFIPSIHIAIHNQL